MEADSLVIWRQATGTKPQGTDLSALQEQGVSDIYVTGNIVFRQGQRTIYADDLYYDLQHKRAVANHVVLKTFDTTRGVPIYIRAKQLRQTAANEFEGDEHRADHERVLEAAAFAGRPHKSVSPTRPRRRSGRPRSRTAISTWS